MAFRTETKDKILIWGIIYWAILTASFLWSMQVRWSSAYPVDFNAAKYIIATISSIITIFLCPRDDSIMDVSLTIVIYLVVMPLGIIYSCQDRETLYYLSVIAFLCIAEVVIKRSEVHDAYLVAGRADISRIIVFISILILILTLIMLYRERGLPSFNAFDLSQTYSIRGSYELESDESLLFKISSKVVIPFLLAICFFKKKYKWTLLLFAIQIVFFLWLANKTTIFSLIILIGAVFIAKSKASTLFLSKVMTIAVAVISFFEGISFTLPGGAANIIKWIYSLFIRRTVFLPAYLKYCYYDFFILKDNKIVGLFGTIFAPFMTRIGIPQPYVGTSFSKVIGENYYDGANANTGIFGAEMAHFGYFGIPVAALCLILFLLLIRRSEISNGKLFTCCLTIYMVCGLADAGAIDIFDYSPMLLIALLLYFFKLPGYQAEKEKLQTGNKKGHLNGRDHEHEHMVYKEGAP